MVLFTFPIMAVTLLIAGLCYRTFQICRRVKTTGVDASLHTVIPDDTTRLALVATWIFLFALAYSVRILASFREDGPHHPVLFSESILG